MTERIRVLRGADLADASVAGVKEYRRPVSRLLDEFPRWMVITNAVDLPRFAEWVKEANRRHKLCGLLIEHGRDARFVTAMLQRAELHTLAHTLVHDDPAVFRRVVEAWAADAQEQLIADATLERGRLFVRTCAMELLEIDLREVRALKPVPESSLGDFEIDEDGSYLHWRNGDVHVSLEAIRAIIDPEYLTRLRAETLARNQAFGAAIREIRLRHQLRQSDIDELSARQVGRIERGEVHPRLDSLEALAESHGLETDAYLDAIARACRGEPALNPSRPETPESPLGS